MERSLSEIGTPPPLDFDTPHRLIVVNTTTIYKTPNSHFQINDSIRYKNEVQNEMVELVDINKNDHQEKSTVSSFCDKTER